MIEIVKMGEYNKSEHTCQYCGCVFKYDYSDVVHRNLTVATPVIQCPCCHKFTSLQNWTYINHNEYFKDFGGFKITC